MRALVVFESMYGDAQAIAGAVAEGLATRLDVTVCEVDRAPTLVPAGVDLLVVGGPTHGMTLSSRASREKAAAQAHQTVTPQERGLRDWLDSLPDCPAPIAAAVFSTRLGRPRWLRLFWSSGRASAGRLRRRGFRLVAPVADFYVAGVQGPLLDGEEDRAYRWGMRLAQGSGAAREEGAPLQSQDQHTRTDSGKSRSMEGGRR